eukprot:747351-Hanusia_phi.AAC.1
MGGRRGRVLEEAEEGLGKREEMRDGIFNEICREGLLLPFAAMVGAEDRCGDMHEEQAARWAREVRGEKRDLRLVDDITYFVSLKMLVKTMNTRDVVTLSTKQTFQDLSIMVGLVSLLDALVARARSRRMAVEASGRADVGDVISVLKERLDLRDRALLSVARMKVQTEVPKSMLEESIEEKSIQDRRSYRSIIFDQLISSIASNMLSSAKFHALTMNDLLDALVDPSTHKSKSSLSQLRLAILYLACNFNGKHLLQAGEDAQDLEEAVERLEESLIRISQALRCEAGERELAVGLWWLDASNVNNDDSISLATRYLGSENAQRVLPRFLRSAIFSSLYDLVFANKSLRNKRGLKTEPSLTSMTLMAFKNLEAGQSGHLQDVALYLLALQSNTRRTSYPATSPSSGWAMSEALATIMERMSVEGAFQFVLGHDQEVDEQTLTRCIQQTLQFSLREHFEVEDFSFSCWFDPSESLQSKTQDVNANVDSKSASVRFRLQFESEEGCKQAFAIFTSDASKDILTMGIAFKPIPL